jgi:predicted DNA-binding protein YlxM (UPF0122 family)
MKAVHANVSQHTRRAENACRDKIDLLRSRMSLLTGKDRLLLTMYLDKGNSFRQIARLAGVNDSIIARRIRKLIKRLTDSQYITCLRNRNRFTEAELAIAKERFMTGLSIEKIAQKYQLTHYRVDRILEHIQEISTTIRQDPA